MDITLVSFQENSDTIGLKYLQAFIDKNGFNSSILLIANNNPENIDAALDYIKKNKTKVLGVSAMTYEMHRAKDFISRLKSQSYHPIIIFGGIHATSDPEDCLSISDIVVKGEGEETLLDLLKILIKADEPEKADISAVNGIAFKHNHKIVHTPVRQPLENLNQFSFPGHLPDHMFVAHGGRIRCIKEQKIYEKYARYQGTFLSILSSRGCPFSCHYCCNSVYRLLYGPKPIRKRSPQNVIAEIKEEISKFKGILYINFQDDCFLMNSLEWIEEFSRLYLAEIKIPFIIRTTPRHIKKEKLVLLKKVGLRWVFIGLQTGSDYINKEIYGRNETFEEMVRATKVASELNLSLWYDVILDNPYEKESHHLKTIELLLTIPRPFQLNIFSLDYFPGTQLRQRAINDKIPIPEPGKKSYTNPEPKMINRYIRMSATLAPFIVRWLLRISKSSTGKILAMIFYYFSLVCEPFIYLLLIWKSNDCKPIRTLKVIKAFYRTAIRKLFLRKQG